MDERKPFDLVDFDERFASKLADLVGVARTGGGGEHIASLIGDVARVVHEATTEILYLRAELALGTRR